MKKNIPIKDLHELFMKQKELNERILRKKNISMPVDEMIDNQKIAFTGELMEFVEETKIVKYWKTSEPSPRAVTLEEYADGFHFCLSVGLYLGYGTKIIPQIAVDDAVYTERKELYTQILDVQYHMLTGQYTGFLESYIRLGFMCGYTWNDIVDAYNKKNKKNHERQDNNY